MKCVKKLWLDFNLMFFDLSSLPASAKQRERKLSFISILRRVALGTCMQSLIGFSHSPFVFVSFISLPTLSSFLVVSDETKRKKAFFMTAEFMFLRQLVFMLMEKNDINKSLELRVSSQKLN